MPPGIGWGSPRSTISTAMQLTTQAERLGRCRGRPLGGIGRSFLRETLHIVKVDEVQSTFSLIVNQR
jgi:hypothetical protein